MQLEEEDVAATTRAATNRIDGSVTGIKGRGRKDIDQQRGQNPRRRAVTRRSTHSRRKGGNRTHRQNEVQKQREQKKGYRPTTRTRPQTKSSHKKEPSPHMTPPTKREEKE